MGPALLKALEGGCAGALEGLQNIWADREGPWAGVGLCGARDQTFRCFFRVFSRSGKGTPQGRHQNSGSGGGVLGAPRSRDVAPRQMECTWEWVAQRELAMGEALHLEAQPSPRGYSRHHPLSIQ